jgi:1-phosphatidylinositol phosphodiesterase
VLPIEAAAGPMNRTIEGINDVTGQWLDDFGGGGDVLRTGIVIADFPGKKLIESVLAWNEPLMP